MARFADEECEDCELVGITFPDADEDQVFPAGSVVHFEVTAYCCSPSVLMHTLEAADALN